MKKILYIILGLVAILLIAFVIFLNLPKSSSKNKKAEITITAVDLFKDFSENERKANNTYNGKIIEVQGKVLAVSKDQQSLAVVILDAQDEFDGVLCSLEQNPKELPKVGDDIKVKGQCNGFLMGVVMNKCVIVE